MSPTGNQGVGTTNGKVEVGDLESMISESPNAENVCLKLAKYLHVQRCEVALLRLEKNSLRFIFPVELRTAGVLPLTGSAVAARTAATRTPVLSNTFMRVKHVSLFEAIKLVGAEEEDRRLEQMPIQKIMSVPVVNAGGKVLGVVQVSRKGPDASLAGADFTGDDIAPPSAQAMLLTAADQIFAVPVVRLAVDEVSDIVKQRADFEQQAHFRAHFMQGAKLVEKREREARNLLRVLQIRIEFAGEPARIRQHFCGAHFLLIGYGG